MWRLTAVLSWAICLAAQDPPAKPGISGRVVDAVSGQPLGKVELMLEGGAKGAPPAGASSDAKGNFTLVDLEPGTYQLHLRRNGYLDVYYGAKRSGVRGTAIALQAGQEVKDLECKLSPFAVIAGAIRDSDGEPLSGAVVMTVHMKYSRGVRRPDVSRFTVTDDLGQYRIADLPPGKYYVGAQPHGLEDDDSGVVDHSADGAHRVQVLQRAFYPGVADPRDARQVEVAAGSRVGGIDIALTRSRVFRVAGRVAIPPGVEAGDLRLAGGSWSEFSMLDRNITPARDGKFELRGVPPGAYDLTAYGKAGRRPYLARARVVVADADIDTIRVELAPGPEVAGKVVVDGTPGKWTGRMELVDGARRFEGEVTEDGTFSVEALPGHYDVIYNPGNDAGGRLFVKAIRAGSTDVFHEGVTMAEAGTVSLEVTLAPDNGAVEGMVVDAGDKPLAGVTVVAAPEAALRRRYDLFRQAMTDQNGRFELKTLPPGEYKLFAWDDVEPGIWQDPEFLKDAEKQGQAVTIRKDGQETVRLHVPGAGR